MFIIHFFKYVYLLIYVIDSPHKIFIGGLPAYLNDEQVRYMSCKIFSGSFLALWSIISRGTLGPKHGMRRMLSKYSANFFFNFQHVPKFQVLFFVFFRKYVLVLCIKI